MDGTLRSLLPCTILLQLIIFLLHPPPPLTSFSSVLLLLILSPPPPQEHYAIMRKTWEAEASSRPTFALLLELMKRIEPEVRKATQDFPDPEPRKDFLFYKQGDLITVLDKK